MNGIINIYKEKGYTSHDVVAKLRGILRMKRIGHTGTLDPDAEGVLPVCIGKATSLCEYLTDKDKEYETVIHLGVTTDTLDMTGNILSRHNADYSLENITEVINGFIGEQQQIPPMYSAIKINGKKLYELARNGKEIERKPRQINIKNIEILSYDDKNGQVKIRTTVSKGTYIRSLCDDIGKKLGCGAAMGELIRTRSGIFNIREAVTLNDMEQSYADGISEYIIPLEAVFDMPERICLPGYDKYIMNGNAVKADMLQEYDSGNHMKPFVRTGDEDICVYSSDEVFRAIYRYERKEDIYKPLKMFI